MNTKRTTDSKNDFIKKLEIFKKKADRVEVSKNLILKKHSLNLAYSDNNKTVKTSLTGIETDDYETLSVLVRIFWAKGSDIQINKIINYILNPNNKFDEEIIRITRKIQKDYKKHLASGICFAINQYKIENNEDLLEVFFNGDIFHSEEKYLEVIDLCKKNESYLVIRQSFFYTLQGIATIICFFNNLVVKKILKNFKQQI